MNEIKKTIKAELENLGHKVYVVNGGEAGTEFWAVLENNYKKNSANFEPVHTEIGLTSNDYYTFTGPYDENILNYGDSAVLYDGDDKYIFKKREAVSVGGTVIYYFAILKRAWE